MSVSQYAIGASGPEEGQGRVVQKRADFEAAVLVLASTITQQQRAGEVRPRRPDATLQSHVFDAAPASPNQFAFLAMDSIEAQWLEIAAVAEQQRCFDPAQAILLALHGIARNRQRLSVDEGAVVPEEIIGICWVRLGRIARTAGYAEDAREYYRLAGQITRGRPLRDASPLAELGLVALAASQGNYPAAGRRASRLLSPKREVHAVHRFSAHTLLALVRRKQGRLLDALLHAWAAYDLLRVDDVRAWDVGLSMAEIATDANDFSTAEHAFTALAHPAMPDRVRLSALVGLTKVSLRRMSTSPDGAILVTLGELTRDLTAICQPTLGARDHARALLALADLRVAAGELDLATQHVESARGIATRFGLFEQQFVVDTLTTRLVALRANAAAERARAANEIPRPFIALQHPALARLRTTTFRPSMTAAPQPTPVVR